MAVFFALSFPFGALGGGGGSSMMSGSSKGTMLSSVALLRRLKKGFSYACINPPE